MGVGVVGGVVITATAGAGGMLAGDTVGANVVGVGVGATGNKQPNRRKLCYLPHKWKQSYNS